ncbi:MAG: phosphoribosylamine--glycine ligase [Cyclobacteriaceae bacterium]
MNILILGSGGREHTLAWKIKQSPKCKKIFVAPGNGGTENIAQNLDLNLKDFDAVAESIKANKIDLLVVGPEEPLVNGIVDYLKKDKTLSDLKIIGPESKGAMLEGSKEFSKDFMNRHKIPTAKAKVITADNLEDGDRFLDRMNPPFVLKADGLAGGKGVIITEELQEAKKALRDLLVNKKFGKASERVLIEEFLRGIEVSFFVLTDGKDYRILPEAKDYKRIFDNDQGPNTGGMGAVSPVVFADRSFKERVSQKIIKPTIQGLRDEKIDYCGFLFFGLINVGGEPYVIEYNARMGDPETQVVLPRIKSDFLELLIATADGNLVDTDIEYERFSAATVVLVSRGYPEFYEKGHEISIGDAKMVLPFHAGTTINAGKLVTNGGRVLALTGLGKNLAESLGKCYSCVDEVNWEGKKFRSDIGFDLTNLGQ